MQPNTFSQVQHIEVHAELAGQRLDNYLFRILNGVPKTHVYRIIRKGEVRVNRKRAKPILRLNPGDIIRLPPLQLQTKSSVSASEKFIAAVADRILYENNQLLVLNKPAGLPVHGGTGQLSTVMGCVRALRPNCRYLELAHRLDKETSGCLIIAKKASVLKALHELFRTGQVEKHYMALVNGCWQVSEFVVELPLLKQVMASGERRVVVDQTGKACCTLFHTERCYQAASLMSIRLASGRTHQIRVHAAANGHGLAGDDKYGDFSLNRRWRQAGLKRLFLHASQISFTLPEMLKPMTLQAPLDANLQAILERLS